MNAADDVRSWVGDVLVVGAGPAGLAAAEECAREGLRVVLVDENQRPGGQIGRQPFVDPEDHAEPERHTEPLIPAGVTFLPRVVCHGFGQDGNGVFSRDGAPLRITAARTVLATGAVEKVLPVPGWTLPGVMTAGAAQSFLKGSGHFPYKRVVVAGTGPLLLAVASQLLSAGVDLVALAEGARPTPRQGPDALRTLAAPSLLGQGAGYAARLLRAGVRVRTGTGVRRIEGEDRVTGAHLGRLRRDWSFDDDAGSHVSCDAVLLSHGFASVTDLVAQRGADIEWDEQRSTWRPVRDSAFRTSVDGVHAVGDCAGVGGAQRAALEGRITGLVIAAEVNGRAYDRRRVTRLRRRLARLETFRAGMDRLFPAPGPGAATWPDPLTQVCRCQEVTRAEVDEACDHGARDFRSLKLWTRAGMGPCQGRVCAPALCSQLDHRGHPTARLDPPVARFPVRPLPLGAARTHSHDD